MLRQRAVFWQLSILQLCSCGLAAQLLPRHTMAFSSAPWTEQDTNLPGPSSTSYVAMCLIVKDQKSDILEWIEHYLNLGVGKVYVFDNGSNSPILSAFSPLIEAGHVEYHWMTNEMMRPLYKDSVRHTDGGFSPQGWVYHECLRRYSRLHHWMAFFDADEFLILKDRKVENLPVFLKDYEAFGGLAVMWSVFGSSGLLTRPNGTTLSAYTQCFRTHFVKIIANTRYALWTAGDPHVFRYRDAKFSVNEVFQRVDRATFKEYHADKVVLNHYMTKSLAEFMEKMQRGDGHVGATPRDMSFFDNTNRRATNSCLDATELMVGRSYLSTGARLPGLIFPAHRDSSDNT